MDYAVTAQQMKAVDQNTIKNIGIPSMVLMERAALAVAEAAEHMAKERNLGKKARILAVCGTGNNGADGVAAGRILQGRGYNVCLLLVGNTEHDSEEMKTQKQIARNLDLAQCTAAEYQEAPGDIILDAVFGIGLGREIGGEYRKVLEMLASLREQYGTGVIAVDTPSGIHGTTGEIMGIALEADITVTFGFAKTGLLLYPGKYYAGNLVVADIGFPQASLLKAGWDAKLITPDDLSWLPKRQPDGNKGTFGKVLVIAGSRGMSGAAYFSALGAYRTGAGLVKILTVPENLQVLQTQLPEAIISCYDPDQDAFPGTIFSYDTHNLASDHIQVDIIQSNPIGKTFSDMSDIQYLIYHRLILCVCALPVERGVGQNAHIINNGKGNDYLCPNFLLAVDGNSIFPSKIQADSLIHIF